MEIEKTVMSGMDGLNHTNLISENVEWPNRLAVNDILDHVYRSYAELNTVESVRVDNYTGQHCGSSLFFGSIQG